MSETVLKISQASDPGALQTTDRFPLARQGSTTAYSAPFSSLTAAHDGRYLQLTGGNLSGPVTLPADPTSSMQAATKSYVDSHSGGVDLASPPPIGNTTPNNMDAMRIILHGASAGQSLSAAIGIGNWSGGNVTLTDTGSGGAFTGSIAGNTLTVSAISAGTNLGPSIYITGSGVTLAMITAQTSGTTGGVGVYTINGSAQTVSSRAMTGYTYATAWNGSCQLGRAGSQGFGLFSWNTLTTTGTVVNELDAANNSSADSTTPFPPGQSFGTSYNLAIGLQLVANGTHRSTVGAQVIGTSSAVNFQRGFYTWPGSCSDYGVMVDATSADTMTAGGYFRASTNHIPLACQVRGTANPTNVMFVCDDDSGAAVAEIFQSGSFAGGYVYPLADNAKTCGLSTNRWNTIYATSGTVNTSDPALKTDIRALDFNATDFVRAVRPIAFRWKEERKDPVPAERIEMVHAAEKRVTDGHVQYEYLFNEDGSPRMVEETRYTTEYVSVPGTQFHLGFDATEIKARFDALHLDCAAYVDDGGIRSLRPTELIPILWRAVQELSTEVKELRERRAG